MTMTELEDAIADLIDRAIADGLSREEAMSALELRLAAMEEEEE